MSRHLNFKVRIASWSEATVLREIGVRETKLRFVQPQLQAALWSRLEREKKLLSTRLAELRNLELFKSVPGGVSGHQPAAENAP